MKNKLAQKLQDENIYVDISKPIVVRLVMPLKGALLQF